MKRKGATTSRPFSCRLAVGALGGERRKSWRGATDGSPQAERDFKFTRQATNKIGGISKRRSFLGKFF